MCYRPLVWLDKKIKEKGYMKAKDVFLAMLDGDGTIYVDA